MSTGMNGTTSRGVFQSIASLQAADVDTNTVVWVADGDSYDIKAADGSESFLLSNGRGAFLRAPANPNVEWDFEAVFNDGVELRSGYGTRNTHGNKAVDFSRASETGSINKSDVLETLAVDEPSVIKGGVEIYEGVVNEMLWSEDLLNSVWVKRGVTIALSSSTVFGVAAFDVSASVDDDYVSESIVLGSSEGVYNFSFIVNKLTSDRIHYGVYDETTSTWIIDANSTSSDISNGEGKRISVNFTKPSGSTLIRLYPFRCVLSDNSRDAVITGAQLTKTSKPFPYRKTESAPATRSPDICSTPVMGNMPPAGSPFTIEVDFTNEETVGYFGGLLSTNPRVVTEGFELRRTNVDQVRFVFSDGVTEYAVNSSSCILGGNRITVTFDGNNLAMHANGDIDAQLLNKDIFYKVTADLLIGNRINNQAWNNPLKALRIAHKALTLEQIAARGGYPYD